MQAVRGSLVGPWAVSGLCGGWLYLEAFGLLRESSVPPFAPLLVILTPAVAGLFGWILTTHARKFHRGFSPALAFGVTLVAGLANGILIGGIGGACADFPAGFLWGTLGGGIFGVICSIPFLVPLAISARLALSHGKARERSLVDRSDRRIVWAALAPCASLAALLVEASSGMWHPPSVGFLAIASLAVPFALGISLVDLAAWWSASAEGRRTDDGHRDIVDVGIGDDTVVRTIPAKDAYRDVDRQVHVLRGSPLLAERILRGRVVFGITATLITAVAALAAIHTHIDREPPAKPETSLSVVPPAPPPPAVRVRYTRAESAGHVELLGARASDHTAYVMTVDRGLPRVHAINWEADTEIGSWQLGPDETAQWLTIARGVGQSTVHPSGLPIFDSAAEPYAYVDSSSRLFAVSKSGARPRALTNGPASEVMFAPSGSTLAFVAGHHLQIADAANATPATPVNLIDPGAPLFISEDRIFVVASGAHGDCVYQVDPHHLGTDAPIFCPKLSNLVMIGDPQRRTAAVCGTLAPSGTTCTWLELPSGAVKGRVSTDRVLSPLTLGPNGLLVSRADDATAYVSLKDEGQFRFDVQPDADIDARGGKWIDDVGTLVLLRRAAGEWDIVEIDVDRMIDGSARSTRSTPSP